MLTHIIVIVIIIIHRFSLIKVDSIFFKNIFRADIFLVHNVLSWVLWNAWQSTIWQCNDAHGARFTSSCSDMLRAAWKEKWKKKIAANFLGYGFGSQQIHISPDTYTAWHASRASNSQLTYIPRRDNDHYKPCICYKLRAYNACFKINWMSL